MKLVYFCSTGSSDPTRASIPFHLAVNGSAEVGHDVEIVLGGDATEIVIGDMADKIVGVGIPPMKDLLNKAKERRLPVYV